MKKLTYLSGRIRHRLSGSEAFNRAVAWSAQPMKEGGLENVSTPLVKIPHGVRGKESAEIVSSVKLTLGMLGLGLRPKRTIRVVFWANDENGKRGGLAYRDQNKDPLKNHVMAIEMDGRTEGPLGLGVTSGGDRALAQMRATGKLLQPVGAGQLKAGGGGTDIGPIMRDGVIGSGVRTVGERCFEWRHAESGTIDKINPDDFRRNSAHLAVFACVLADRDERLGQ
jgi:hypothetical protein